MIKRKPYSLTNKEKDRIHWAFIKGKTSTEVAKEFEISLTTAKYYRNPLVHKARIKRHYQVLKVRGGRKRS